MRVEEQYMDVLQNIEFGIVQYYHMFPAINDYNVMRALEALIDEYTGEKIGRPPRNFRLSDTESNLVGTIRMVCEWRLGREESEETEDAEQTPAETGGIGVDEIILCLKRLLKSVNRWNKEGGTRGYLNFIVQYVH